MPQILKIRKKIFLQKYSKSWNCTDVNYSTSDFINTPDYDLFMNRKAFLIGIISL
jgi:hypothetical protein